MQSLDPMALVETLDDLFFVYDRDGCPVEWNRAVVEVTGYTDAEIATMAPTEFFHGDDRERVAAAIERLFETGSATVEAAVVTADGDRVPYEFNGQRLDTDAGETFVGIGRDITERRQQREALTRRESVLREMYRIVADRDREFGEQVSALLALGREELDIRYGTLSAIHGDEYVFEVVDAADDSIRAGDVVPVEATNCEIVASTERTLVLGDVARDAPGETDRAGYAEWGISCYLGAPVYAEGDVYGTFCFYDTEPRAEGFSDWEVTLVDLMTRWVSYELDRTRTTERLRRTNQQLERFSSVISHDLRTPLSTLEGSLELAAETGDPAHFDRCRRALDRMGTLIDDLLSLAKAGMELEDLEDVDLGTFVRECWADVETGDASLRVDTSHVIRADPTALRQLLENLVRNAVDHGGEDVRVTVGALPEGFYVADDGPGFPADVRERAFEYGYTSDPAGTGFGLAIVEEFADAHGWTVTLPADATDGARVEIAGVEVVDR